MAKRKARKKSSTAKKAETKAKAKAKTTVKKTVKKEAGKARKTAKKKRASAKAIRKAAPAERTKKTRVKRAVRPQRSAALRRRGVHHLIIGSGPAGLNAIETIRSLDGGSSRITLIGDEPAYSRMVLPYYIAGRIPSRQVFTGDDRYFKDLGTDTIFGKRAVFVDTKAGAVTLQDGQRIEYDDLLIATGGSAVRPVLPGADAPGVETLWTLADTESVLKRLTDKSRVVFLGAGFIGFIVLNAMAKRGCRIDVIEREPRLLPYMLDAKAAELVETHLRSKQIGIHTGSGLKAIHEQDGHLVAELVGGTRLDADVVILATGVRPNLGFLEGSGLNCRRGLLVDDRLRTNVRNVYAAGDCAEGPDLLNGERTVHAIQPTAVDHGRVVGANMAGKRVTYRGSLLMNILDVVGVQCASFGRWDADTGDVQTLVNPGRPAYRKIVWEDDRIVGATLLGPSADLSNLNDMGMIKGIIQTQTPLGPFKDHLRRQPLDIRRAYLGAGVAQTLLNTTLLGVDAEDRGYRYKNAAPAKRQTSHHKVFHRDFVPAPPTVAGPPH